MGQLLAPGLANHSRLLKVTLVACQDDGGIAPGMRLDLSAPAHRAASHSTCASDTEHPTQTTQHMGFRHTHRPSHTDNTARGLQTQTIPHRQHSMWASDTHTEHPTQTTQHVCIRHRHRTSHTDNTAVVHLTQTQNIPHRQHSMCASDTDTEHPTQRTQHMYIRHREHSMRASDTDQEHSTCMS